MDFGNLPSFGDISSATLTTWGLLRSAELNVRRWNGGLIHWISGFRWLEWDERMNLDYTYSNAEPYGSGNVNASTGNNLYGGQIGGEAAEDVAARLQRRIQVGDRLGRILQVLEHIHRRDQVEAGLGQADALEVEECSRDRAALEPPLAEVQQGRADVGERDRLALLGEQHAGDADAGTEVEQVPAVIGARELEGDRRAHV